MKLTGKTKGPEALVSHLRAFHCRFRFEAKWNPAKLHLNIEVCISDTFDCSNDCGLRRWAAVDSARYCKRVAVLDGAMVGGWDGLGSSSSQSYQGSGAPSNGCSGNSTPKDSVLPNSNEVYQFQGVLGESVNSSVYALSRGFCRVRRPIRRPPFTELIFWHGLSKNLSWLTDPTISLKPRC
ncbi:Polycomb protein suz12, partial [Cichlidogyrus casuarinus]